MSKYKLRLDKTRPHGTYHPPEKGAYYNQDGYDFDHEGHIVEERLTPKQREELAKKAAPPAPKKVTSPAGSNQSGGDGAEGGGQQQTGTETDGLNLELWLKGEEDYEFPAVQQAVKARYNVWKTSKRDLLLFLVEEQKVVATDELSDQFKSMIA